MGVESSAPRVTPHMNLFSGADALALVGEAPLMADWNLNKAQLVGD